MTKEAKEVLEEWLKQRDAYLKSSLNRGAGLSKTGYGRGLKSAKSDNLFPFSGAVAEQMWWTALRKAGLTDRDSSTNRRKIHPHMLRKFFQTQMKYAGIAEDVVEALIGHSGYLDEAYRRYTKEQIASSYKKGEIFLLINAPEDIKEVQKNVTELQSQTLDLTRKLADSNTMNLNFIAQNQKMQEKLEQLEKQVKDWEVRVKRFEDWVQKFMGLSEEELITLSQEIFRRKEEERKQVTNLE
jgi:hypothetical protein